MLEDHNQYAPMLGMPALRSIIADVIKRSFNSDVDPETEITVTSGATEAIYAVIAAFITPGDEVIVFDPSYDSYNPVIRLNGGIPIHLNLLYPDFSVDWDLVRSKISPRTRMIIINTPHNPSGAILRESDLKELEAIALKHNILVLSDEAYERLIFDGNIHQSVLAISGTGIAKPGCIFVWKNLSCHWVEDRLRRCACILNARDKKDSSVYCFQCEHTHSTGIGRIHEGSRAL